MAGLLTTAIHMYDEIMEKADPRMTPWFTMSTPWPCLTICICYFVLVAISPRLMAGYKPMEFRRLLLTYNLAMVALSGYIFVEFLLSGWLTGYSLGCQPVDYSDTPQATRMVRVCWLFYFSKIIELLDTVFFILRKKFNQVSFLHVFHHGIMPISLWLGMKFVPGGFGTFHCLLNSFIHFLMYTYYGLSALGPAFHKYLWWKRYMTTFQIVQFILVTVHSMQLFFIECDYPKAVGYWILCYAVTFLILFLHFYRKAYAPLMSGQYGKTCIPGSEINGNIKSKHA